MEFTYQVESVIRGHHIYKTVWTPFIGETLSLRIEDGNEQDSFAVAVIKNDDIVGHAPRQFSRVFYFFLSHDGTIDVKTKIYQACQEASESKATENIIITTLNSQ